MSQSARLVTTTATSNSTISTTTAAAAAAATTAAAEITTIPAPKKQNARQRLRDLLLQDHEPGVHPIDDINQVRGCS